MQTTQRERKSVGITPDESTNAVITPNVEAPNNSEILTLLKKLERENAEMKKEIAKANWDISEDVKESKRKYGYELDGITRRKDEWFEYGYKVLTHDRKEKVVIKFENIGKPQTVTNYNKGTRQYIHDISLTFHDGSTAEMDLIEFGNSYYLEKVLVPDENIEKKNGKLYYTFETEKFGTFTISQDFING